MIQLHNDATPIRTAASVLQYLEEGGIGSASVATGFHPLDEALAGGVRTQHLTVVGGLPGTGKSAFTLQAARSIAADDRNVVYASYEHDRLALLERLLLLEIGELVEGGAAASKLARASLRAVVQGQRTMDGELASNLLLRAAHARVSEYAEQLWLLRASPLNTSVNQLDDAARQAGTGSVLFVDFLQKVPIEERTSDVERITQASSGLKEIALKNDIAVVAIVAGDQDGLNTRRLRLSQLRGAAGLAYEADVVLMMNEKYHAVSKLHSAFDPIRAEQFKRFMVFSVDKNRDGEHGIDVQFEKDFAHLRFNPAGSYVEERLVDELMYPE